MKRYAILFIAIVTVQVILAQPYPRQECHILNNEKQLTDASVVLYHLHSEYKFPYLIPSKENVTEKLTRILKFLEKSTADAIVDASTGEAITDYNNIPQEFTMSEGDFKPYTYEWGVTYTGMYKSAEATGNQSFKNYADKRLELLSKILPTVIDRIKVDKNYKSPVSTIADPHNLDQCGSMCAAMISSGKTEELRPYIDIAIDFITTKQHRLADKTVARNRPYENTLWLDDLYMCVPALSGMYAMTNERRFLDDAICQILNFKQHTFVPEKKLYMHGWVESMDIHPKFYWGRANGWVMMALCSLLDVMPENHPSYTAILKQYQELCEGLITYQANDGLWNQLLDRNDSYFESSATAMFVYGMAHGINRGWIDARTFGAATLLGWNALSEQINNTGQIENVCIGTSVSFEPAYYCNRHVHLYTAHGYGPVLMAGSEIIHLVQNFDIKQSTAIYFYNRKQ